jgi:hypothetical protein
MTTDERIFMKIMWRDDITSRKVDQNYRNGYVRARKIMSFFALRKLHQKYCNGSAPGKTCHFLGCARGD